ncbi:hypothetical protein QTP88_008777 [Uroleucon formosanum]
MQNKQKQYYDKSTKKLKELKEGDKVYLYKERNGKQWNTGVIRELDRTETYKNAILLNCSVFESKTVLGVGAGIRMLSIFCA